MWLKRKTPQNIVIGGAAGALPPVIGWAAVAGDIGLAALALFLIIFLWTPPHFWALAIHRLDDYSKADVPMLPVQKGVAFTKQHILLYTVLLFVCTLLPYATELFNEVYLVCAVILGLIFVYYSYRLLVDDSNSHAMPTFAYSIVYLGALFSVMLLDFYIYL